MMPEGTRATVSFVECSGCPVMAAARYFDAEIDNVSRNARPPECHAATTEFTVAISDSTPSEYEEINEDYLAELVYSDGRNHRYRVYHSEGIACPCECIGSSGCTVSRYTPTTDELRIEFCARDFDELRTVIAHLRDRFPRMEIEKLVRSPVDHCEHSSDPVRVDRARLTQRQVEVLEAAFEMGYFDRPRGANAKEVAANLGIHPSTLTEHLTVAQSKLLEEVLERPA